MAWRASSSLVCICGCLAASAMADDRPGPASVPITQAPAPAAFRPAAMAVAAFPDVVPERPKPPPDAALELLATNPYESQLMAHKIAENLFGVDPAFEDPYADERRLANPYTEDLELVSPYTSAERIDNPYSGKLLLLDDPYASPRR